MRVNFLALAALMTLLGVIRLWLNHDVWFGVAFLGLAVVMAVLHFIRVRRFKRFDQTGNFD